MKKLTRLKTLICAAWLAVSAAGPLYAGENAKPFVVPELKQWTAGNGEFTPGAKTRIVCASEDPEVQRVARMLADDYATMFGTTLKVAQGRAAAGDIVLALGQADKTLGQEGYMIQTSDRVELSAPTATGLYWGTRTLLQIAEQSDTRAIPQGTIRDYPDYPLRGFMIDCGRKYIPMTYLRDLVKVMAYYKMNTLQVHLNDNGFKQFFGHDWNRTYAAFRLESTTFPGLTARDGSYSKQEFIDFQHEAADRFVEIIPEIDVPAHSLALSHYKPEIGSKEYGMDHLDIFNPETYRFVDALFKEYLEGDQPVFVGKRVHIGTDEYSNAKKEVVEKFRAFTDHYIRLVESYGKQAMLWGALTHADGDTPVKAENVVMGAWYNGYADPATMIEKGYQLVSIPDGLVYIVPRAGYYYDYLNEPYLYENWTPAHIGKAVFEEQHPSILGGMFAVWNGKECQPPLRRVRPPACRAERSPRRQPAGADRTYPGTGLRTGRSQGRQHVGLSRNRVQLHRQLRHYRCRRAARNGALPLAQRRVLPERSGARHDGLLARRLSQHLPLPCESRREGQRLDRGG